MKIVDTHCHYNLEPLANAWMDHWQTAQTHGVTHSVVVGTDLQSSKLAISIATQQANIYATVGMHPENYHEDPLRDNAADIDSLEQMLSDKVIAIGEVGLDFFRLPSDTETASRIKTAQLNAFVAHIQLAKKCRKPLILHVRDTGETAYRQTLELLKQYADLDIPFILHCVSGPRDYVDEAVSLGAFVGVAGNVTYKNADHIRNLVSSVPTERLLLETDAPFLPPQEFRGKTCEPWMIAKTAEYLSSELRIPLEKLYENSRKLVGF